MSQDRPSGKIPIRLDDPETRRIWESAQVTARAAEQMPMWKRYGDPDLRDARLREFHERWRSFMEGGWVDLIEREPAAVEAARKRALELIPQHPKSVCVAELVARIVDIEQAASQEHLLAALLESESHGHIGLAAGSVFRPQPRIPRRGLCLEDMHYLLGYAPARER